MKNFRLLRNVSPQAKIALNLSIIQGIFYAAWVFPCYCMVYLQELGFSASTIGAISAVNCAVGIFSSMTWGMISDKINSVKKTLIMATVGLATTFTFIPFLPTDAAYSVPMFFAYYSLLNVFKSTAPTLLDNMSIRTCMTIGVNYGVSRSLGSITFAIVSLSCVSFINRFGITVVFVAYGIFAIPLIISMLFAHDPKAIRKTSANPQKREKLNLKPLLKNYYYMTFLLFACFFTTATAGEFSFLSFFMEDIGVSPNNLGTFLACRALCEVPLLITIIKLRRKFKLKYMVIFASLLMSTQCMFLGFFANDLASMAMCGAIFGLGNGLYIGCASTYLFRLAPDNLKASAQTIYTSVCATSGIIGNLLGGYLFEFLGAKNFYICVGSLMLFAALTLIITLSLKKNLPNPADEII